MRTDSVVRLPNITSSFENPNTKLSARSISVISTWSPSSSDRRVESSSPPKPAPRTSTDVVMGARIGLFASARRRPTYGRSGDQFPGGAAHVGEWIARSERVEDRRDVLAGEVARVDAREV